MSTYILTINGGSSSIKYAYFERGDDPKIIFEGVIEGISAQKKITDATGELIALLKSKIGTEHEFIISHRVVHGGIKYILPTRVTDEVLSDLEQIIDLAPNHLPENIELIKALQREFPNIQHVACFDTAFHHNLPDVAQLLPIPQIYQKQGLRRFGFHGLSYESIVEQLKSQGTIPNKLIIAHLGSGTSLCALVNGEPVETSMSLTPNSGVMMGTRSGDIDPGLYWYLHQHEQLDAKKMNDLLNFRSGLRGVSETSNDMKQLLTIKDTDTRAAQAIDLYCYSIQKEIGAFAAILCGLEMLIFTGGIGEGSAFVRNQICKNLSFLGVELDSQENQKNARDISKQTSRTKALVMSSQEALMMARLIQRMK